MGKNPSEKKRKYLWGEVVETERLTPHMFRVVLGGDGLDGLELGPETDHYVKLQLPPPDAPYEAPFDLDEIKARYSRELRPRVRSYSVSDWDPVRGLLTIDFVYHGDRGVAGPWAAAAKPGDRIQFKRPKGKYRPDPEAPWHLMIGDTCVIPAITSSLAVVPEGVPVIAAIEVEGPEDELPLDSPGDLNLIWVHSRESREGGLMDLVEGLEMPLGEPHVFLHGEAEMVRAVRRHLVAERGFDTKRLSVSGYWKRRRTDEEWRAEKSEWKKLVKADA